MSQPVLVNVVMDRSGSMEPLRQATIDGFNSFLRDQQNQDSHCRMSLTMFNTTFDTRYIAGDVHELPELSWFDYNPSGGTALLDAVGTSIKSAEQWILHNGPKQPIYAMGTKEPKAFYPEWVKWKVIVAILTDGFENSSHQWHINQPPLAGDNRDLLGLIKWKQQEGWEFVFLGAGGSDWLEKTFGSVVQHDHFIGYHHTEGAHRHVYAGLSNSVSETRSTGTFDSSLIQEQNVNTEPY